ncbi:MAG: hypothetical protein NTW03_13095 [Verrucomicrobia bacterium]|nr:hypothetical protein [Verrucomicrobiota bacterium]
MKLLSWLLLSLWLVGCKSTITNLTPSQQPRNATGMYPIEVAWDTSQQTVRPASLKPCVVVDTEFYPMRQNLGTTNRWGTVIPVPSGKNTVFYHFRFDYEQNAFGKPTKDSKLSPKFRLDISEK